MTPNLLSTGSATRVWEARQEATRTQQGHRTRGRALLLSPKAIGIRKVKKQTQLQPLHSASDRQCWFQVPQKHEEQKADGSKKFDGLVLFEEVDTVGTDHYTCQN